MKVEVPEKVIDLLDDIFSLINSNAQQAIATARAEALKEAADRAVEWMNKDHYFDPPEPFDNLRAAILADKQESNDVE